MPKKQVYCKSRQPSFDKELRAFVETVGELVKDAESADREENDPGVRKFVDSVMNQTGYQTLTPVQLESLREEWLEKEVIELTGAENTLLLRPMDRNGQGREKDLLVRLGLRYGKGVDCYISMEVFTPRDDGDSGWSVVPVHFDPKNEEGKGKQRYAWMFYHLQSSVRGDHMAKAVRDEAEIRGHRRLPRVPVAADCPLDLLRCAVLSLFGYSELYSRVVNRMSGVGAANCVHLITIERERST